MVIEDKMQENFEAEEREYAPHLGSYGTLPGAVSGSNVFCGFVALALVLWKGGVITAPGCDGNRYAFGFYVLRAWYDRADSVDHPRSVQSGFRAGEYRAFQPPDGDGNGSGGQPEVIERYGDVFHPKMENWEPLHGDVEFRDVSFHYPDGEEMIFEHFNLKVPQGTNVAIVGETGAGKSTLVNLLCRFFEPTEGQILIDGRDVRERS